MYIVVYRNPMNKALEVTEYESIQEIHKRTAHLNYNEFVVLTGKIIKNVNETVIKEKRKSRWNLAIL